MPLFFKYIPSQYRFTNRKIRQNCLRVIKKWRILVGFYENLDASGNEPTGFSTYPSGMYFLTLIQGEDILTEKFIKD